MLCTTTYHFLSNRDGRRNNFIQLHLFSLRNYAVGSAAKVLQKKKQGPKPEITCVIIVYYCLYDKR